MKISSRHYALAVLAGFFALMGLWVLACAGCSAAPEATGWNLGVTAEPDFTSPNPDLPKFNAGISGEF
jgi:hypothetical protein